MRRFVALLFVLTGCGGDGTAGPEADAAPAPGTDAAPPPVGMHASVVDSIPPEGVRALAIAALDHEHVALVRAEQRGDAFCPDCVGLDPSECPDACKRTVISVATTGGTPVQVLQAFPGGFDEDVRGAAIVELGAGRVGVAWLECDDSTCQGLFSKQSCTARYTTVGLADASIGPIQTLYTGWFGDLQLAFDPAARQLLAVVSKQIHTGVGVRAAIFDETGAELRRPWETLGGASARAPSLAVGEGGFLVVADDPNPPLAAPATPCAASCECLGTLAADLETAGLWAFHLGATGPVTAEQVVPGGEGQSYSSREVIQVIRAGTRWVIASSQSIDRSAEIFASDGAAWTRLERVPAPLPSWIGALGDPDHAAWLGSEPAPSNASLQTLVAGVAGADARATLMPAVESHVFQAAPLTGADGIATSFLLQGILRPARDGWAWDRFDVVRVDVDWAQVPARP